MGVSWSSNALINNINFFIKNRWKLNISVSTFLFFFPAYTVLKHAVSQNCPDQAAPYWQMDIAT